VSHMLVWHNMLFIVLLSRHCLTPGWQRSPALTQELMAHLSSDTCLFTCRHCVHGDWRVQSTSGIQALWWYSVLWSVSMDCCLCCNRAAFVSGEPDWLHASSALPALYLQGPRMGPLLWPSACATPPRFLPPPTYHHCLIPALYQCSTCLQVIHIKPPSLLCPLYILQA